MASSSDDATSRKDRGKRQENTQEQQQLVERLAQASKATRNRIQQAEMYYRLPLFPSGEMAIEPGELTASLIPQVSDLELGLKSCELLIAAGHNPYSAAGLGHRLIEWFSKSVMPDTGFARLEMVYEEALPPENELKSMIQAIALLSADLEQIVNPE